MSNITFLSFCCFVFLKRRKKNPYKDIKGRSRKNKMWANMKWRKKNSDFVSKKYKVEKIVARQLKQQRELFGEVFVGWRFHRATHLTPLNPDTAYGNGLPTLNIKRWRKHICKIYSLTTRSILTCSMFSQIQRENRHRSCLVMKLNCWRICWFPPRLQLSSFVIVLFCFLGSAAQHLSSSKRNLRRIYVANTSLKNKTQQTPGFFCALAHALRKGFSRANVYVTFFVKVRTNSLIRNIYTPKNMPRIWNKYFDDAFTLLFMKQKNLSLFVFETGKKKTLKIVVFLIVTSFVF